MSDIGAQAAWLHDFDDIGREWRRLFSEWFGTFLLVMAGAGPGVVAASTHQQIGRAAEVTAPRRHVTHTNRPGKARFKRATKGSPSAR